MQSFLRTCRAIVECESREWFVLRCLNAMIVDKFTVRGRGEAVIGYELWGYFDICKELDLPCLMSECITWCEHRL
jgi:hypothetical protein